VTCKPIWSEGVLVSQHHFQQQDRYHERLLSERLRSALHFEWGITEIEIDVSALLAQQFRLSRFAATWPDGTHVRCGSGTPVAPPEARGFETAFAASDRILPVFVGLPAALDDGNLALTDLAECRRYVPAVRSVVDENDPSRESEIEWARPNLRVFFGREDRRGHDTMKVAELVRDGAGKAFVRDTYVPPVSSLAAAPFLMTGLQRVLTAALARQRDLLGQRNRHQNGALSFHASDAQRFWLLYTLGRAVPELSHLLDVGKAHPEELYVALAALAGTLATFADGDEPTALPRFDFLAQGDVFEALFARVLALLSVEVRPLYRQVELERRSDGMRLGKLGVDVANELFVAVRADVPEELLRERVPRLLKMSDWSQIYDLVKQSRAGVRVEPEWNPSAALPLRAGTYFFRVHREGPAWKAIEKSATVALFLPPEREWGSAVVSLYAIEPEHLA
jgi:type VI secretion system protein ImpJ